MKRLTILILAIILILGSCSPNNFDKENIGETDNDSTLESTDNTEQDPIINELPTAEPEENEDASDIITLVVPEGYTIARIGMRLDKIGVCTVDEFLDAAVNGDYSEFSLVAMQAYNENRCYSLEGYLFPDTYEIYKFDKPETIIKKMLANNEKKFTEQIRDEIAKSDFSVDEIITLASIIQKEAYELNDDPAEKEMPRVSSVLHNRLAIGMMLQCNVTATYVKGVLAEFVEDGFELYNDYYNTYHAPALPAGAICNPSMDAILAAINPADTDYLFFLTDKDKNFYYSAEYEDHLVLEEKHLSEQP